MKYLVPFSIAAILFFTGCNKEPEVSFGASKAEVTVGEKVDFTNESDKHTYNIAWSFGDGGSANSWDASHVYQIAGEYTVTLSGTSKKGNKNVSMAKTIKVNPKLGEGVDEDLSQKIIGEWSLNSAEVEGTACDQGFDFKGSETSNARKFKFNIMNDEGGVITRHSGEKQILGLRLIDEKTAYMDGFYAPITIVGSVQEHTFPSGVWDVTITETKISFTKTEDQYDSSGRCYDEVVYTFELSK